MDSSSANAGVWSGPSPTLNPESLSLLREGISLVLSQWTALRMAIENEWGGRDSHRKSEELVSTILYWFTQSKPPLYIDDLENILDENLVLSFNTEIEDGSVEEVAEHLMIMHEDCLKGNFEPIEKLRKLGPGTNAISQSRRVIDDKEDESSDEEISDMMVDEPKPNEMAVDKPNKMAMDEPKPNKMAMDEPKPKQMTDEEGWSVVPPRRNRGKRSG
ncbi:pre-rRNA-processing protein TSR2 isoform X1 [Phoenix dactylifera]|uniref:Pre-rRNA-processing protein TSR2 isoform X1 n=1 Tax=Phoenix dactylifera TaxID=42345 RepID=A0A8B7D5A4_PHODC|nr:pre-rRNA-processing protein TSR2 isoform X1 [Phoenix dactylifera]